MRNKIDPPQSLSYIVESHDENPESDDEHSESHDSTSESESKSETDPEDQVPRIHVLGLLRRKTIQFSNYCEMEHKWEKLSGKIDLTHSIESFRDAIMIPVNKNIVIFHLQNGSISHAENLALETTTLETITLPNNVECANLALFCHSDDKIFCFARSDQQYYHG